jgi:hypothetical protein
VSIKVVGVSATESLPVGQQPVSYRFLAPRRYSRNQSFLLQTKKLLFCQHDIPQDPLHETESCQCQRTWYTNERSGDTASLCNPLNVVLERHHIWTGRIDMRKLRRFHLIGNDPTGIGKSDGLQSVIASSRDWEDRKTAQEPGDVVGQHIGWANDQSWANDRVREAGTLNRGFNLSFASIVSKI